jgi:hypothetical protein
MYSQAERVFVVKHCSALKSLPAVREAFSSAHRDDEVPNKITIYRLETKFGKTGRVFLRHVHPATEQQKLWPWHQLQRDTAARI